MILWSPPQHVKSFVTLLANLSAPRTSARSKQARYAPPHSEHVERSFTSTQRHAPITLTLPALHHTPPQPCCFDASRFSAMRKGHSAFRNLAQVC